MKTRKFRLDYTHKNGFVFSEQPSGEYYYGPENIEKAIVSSNDIIELEESWFEQYMGLKKLIEEHNKKLNELAAQKGAQTAQNEE